MGGQYGIGLIEEKLRCEAAAYGWISKHCPQVPIPKLWGFGLPSGLAVRIGRDILTTSLTSLQFTPVAHLLRYRRLFELVKCTGSRIFRKPCYRLFVPHLSSVTLKSGYLLIDLIERSKVRCYRQCAPLLRMSTEKPFSEACLKSCLTWQSRWTGLVLLLFTTLAK
jgi:hypothetical protein